MIDTCIAFIASSSAATPTPTLEQTAAAGLADADEAQRVLRAVALRSAPGQAESAAAATAAAVQMRKDESSRTQNAIRLPSDSGQTLPAANVPSGNDDADADESSRKQCTIVVPSASGQIPSSAAPPDKEDESFESQQQHAGTKAAPAMLSDSGKTALGQQTAVGDEAGDDSSKAENVSSKAQRSAALLCAEALRIAAAAAVASSPSRLQALAAGALAAVRCVSRTVRQCQTRVPSANIR